MSTSADFLLHYPSCWIFAYLAGPVFLTSDVTLDVFFTFSDRKLDSVFLKNWCCHLHDGYYALLIVMEKSQMHTSLLLGVNLFLWVITALTSLCILVIMSAETFHAAFTTEE